MNRAWLRVRVLEGQLGVFTASLGTEESEKWANKSSSQSGDCEERAARAPQESILGGQMKSEVCQPPWGNARRDSVHQSHCTRGH